MTRLSSVKVETFSTCSLMYPQLLAVSGKYWALDKYLVNGETADKTSYLKRDSFVECRSSNIGSY